MDCRAFLLSPQVASVPWMQHVAAWLALALLAGTGVGVWLDVDARPCIAMLASSWALAVVFFVTRRPSEFAAATLAGWTAAGAALGSCAAADALDPPLLRQTQSDVPGGCADRCPDGAVQLEGRLRADAEPTEFGAALTLDATQLWLPGGVAPTSGGVRLSVGGGFVPARLGEWTAGRVVRATATLRRPQAYRNVGTLDQESRTALRGVRLTGSIKSAVLVQVVDKGTLVDEAGAAMRGHVRATVERVVGSRDRQAAAVILAVLIGDRAGLSPDVELRLQRAGTFHVIAISGGNIALLVGLVLWTLRSLGLPPRTQAVLTLASMGAYAAIVASGSSVARATLGASLYLIARALDHRASPVAAIGVAAGLLLAARPLAVLDLGFWLTFVASLAILEQVTWLSEIICRTCRVPASGLMGRALGAPIVLLSATLVAETALAPLTAMAFGQVTIAGALLNFAAVPLMSIVQMAGLAIVAAGSISDGLAYPAGTIGLMAARGITESARAVELAPWAAPHVSPPAFWLVAVVMVAWRCAWVLPRRRARRFAGTVWLLGLFVAIAGWPPTFDGPWRAMPLRRPLCEEPELPAGERPTRWLRATFLDVAQGDATLVRRPDGTAMIVDAGGAAAGSRFDVGARVVAPALWAMGVGRLSTIVVTHGDVDHIGGVPALLDRFTPRDVWEGIAVPAHEPLRALAAKAVAGGARWQQVHAGEVSRHGVATLRVWHPQAPDWERRRIRNDDSVVLELRLGSVSIVLPGDVGQDVEARLAASIPPAPLRVLKAAHHGSRQSSSPVFLDALAPRVSVISAGRDNRYGHPSPAVLARLRERGVEVFRTDRDGAISLDTDGTMVRLSTCSGRTMTLAPLKAAPSVPR